MRIIHSLLHPDKLNHSLTLTTGHAQLQFRHLLEKLPAAAYTCDPDGLITYFNQQAVNTWGRTPRLHHPEDRFCGSFKLFEAASGQPIRHDQCWMARALRNDQEYNGHEIIVQRPDGQHLTVLAYANPIHDEAGKLLGAVNVLVDITDRKQAEERLREADRAKDEFLATLAHELRNPLAPIRNAVQILRLEDPATVKSKWALEVIERQMRQMTRLIDDLLDLSRITRNQLELKKERVELADLIAMAVETARPLIQAAGHSLTVSLPPQPLLLNADATRIAQALANLLNNAAKYTAAGGQIVLAVERQGSDAVISVKDNGIGIAADILPKIFDMFVQADAALSRAQGGLGIGLSLVKRLIEVHAGSIQAKSDGPGKGSEFIVRLPILLQPSLERGPAAPEPRPNRHHSSLRILIADDNRDSADSLAMLLRLTGHQVQTVYDGQQAVNAAQSFRPQVVLLDIGMPNLNGYGAAQNLRQQPGGNNIVLIALTGWGQESDRQRSTAAGFDHHIVKPINPPTLLNLLATLETPASTQYSL